MRAKERIEKYGIESFLKMRGVKPRTLKWKELFKYYKAKYPTAAIKIEPAKPEISWRQLKYWKNVKRLSESRGISITKARAILKRERAKGELRLINRGQGYQLYLKGRFLNPKTGEEAIEEGFSHVRAWKSYKISYEECIRYAQATLGGSNWELVREIKVNWIRYYGIGWKQNGKKR